MASYIHGYGPHEHKRLSLLNDIMNGRCMEKIRVAPGSWVLDVGSGLGQLTTLLATAAGPSGFCLGIEKDSKQIETAVSLSADLEVRPAYRSGEASVLPLRPEEEGRFDLAHTRFLLEHVPSPAQVVAEMKKALRPGGRIWLADDDHQAMTLFPEPSGFQELWTAYMDSFIEIGCDPFIGRKLHKLLRDQGFESIRIDTVFFGDCAGSPTFQAFCTNLVEVIGTAKTVMLESGLLTSEKYDESISALRAWSDLPDAAIWYPLCMATAIRS